MQLPMDFEKFLPKGAFTQISLKSSLLPVEDLRHAYRLIVPDEAAEVLDFLASKQFEIIDADPTFDAMIDAFPPTDKPMKALWGTLKVERSGHPRDREARRISTPQSKSEMIQIEVIPHPAVTNKEWHPIREEINWKFRTALHGSHFASGMGEAFVWAWNVDLQRWVPVNEKVQHE